MGWCHEFGVEICAGCGEAMVPGVGACSCATCGTVCTGRFRGCPDVWERGPQPVVLAGRRTAPARATPTTRTGAVGSGLGTSAGAGPRPGTGPSRGQGQGPGALPADAGVRGLSDELLAMLVEEIRALRGEVARQADELAQLAGRLPSEERLAEAATGTRDDAVEERMAELTELLPQRLGAALGRALRDALDGRAEGLASLVGRLEGTVDALEQAVAVGEQAAGEAAVLPLIGRGEHGAS
ncbi:MAG: hypothetical protein IPM45_16225 [Acidimicrobiales bacterium]|nr:hypothetical protein [Acidimicrobiales bacterium]